MNRPAPVKQADITRALKAAEKAGFAVARFEVDQTGKLIVYGGAESGQAAPNEWDEVLR